MRATEGWFVGADPGSGKAREKTFSRDFERRRSDRSEFFAVLGNGFAQIFRQITFISVKTLKREKASLQLTFVAQNVFA